MANWGDLPSVILLEIMRYLNKRDRLSCGVVCKHWYATMCNPLVWKNLCILLDADLTDPLTMVVVRRYAPHITSLDISWSRPYLPRRWIRSRLTTVAHDTMNFLTHLKECNLELVCFKLNDWYFTWKYKKVICNLSTFLKNQRKLQYIDLSNAFLNKNDILKILKGCEASHATIKFINLLGSFHEWNNVALNPTFASLLQQFTNLGTLKLDYSSFSDNILSSFIENKNTSLKYIEIHLKESDNRSHVMSSLLWKKITNTCKNLRVGLHICNICHYGDIYYMLVDAIPLQTFVLSCPNVWDMTRSRSYCGTLNLLLCNYESTLTRVTLNLRNNREIIDESLFEMIRKCKMLEYLEFDGVLQSVDFIRDVCDLQCNCSDYAHKYFHVRPRNASINNNSKLSEIWRTYVTPMKQNDFRFEVETLNNPTVRIYC